MLSAVESRGKQMQHDITYKKKGSDKRTEFHWKLIINDWSIIFAITVLIVIRIVVVIVINVW